MITNHWRSLHGSLDFIVENCTGTFLGDIQLCGTVLLCCFLYHVMDLVSCLKFCHVDYMAF